MDFKKITEKSKNFLVKLQNLPEDKKKVILYTIVIILVLVMGFVWIMDIMNNIQKIDKNTSQIKLPEIQMPDIKMPNLQATDQNGATETESWQTYANAKYGFGIKYPSDWNFREYDTGTGVAFFPKNKPNEQGSINVGFYKRGSAYCKIPFDDYAKIAGPSEIQNYQSLNTINKGASDSGVNMYGTTWNYNDSQGNGKISLPITYFEMKTDLCGDIEAFLNDNNYSDIYNKMIFTLNFTK